MIFSAGRKRTCTGIIFCLCIYTQCELLTAIKQCFSLYVDILSHAPMSTVTYPIKLNLPLLLRVSVFSEMSPQWTKWAKNDNPNYNSNPNLSLVLALNLDLFGTICIYHDQVFGIHLNPY